MTRILVVATGNPHKLDELRELLAGLPLRVIGLRDLPAARRPAMPDETGATFEENADLKAVHVARATGEWALADDSGFEVPALGGRPGVISARYAGVEGPRAAVDLANNRRLIAEARAAGLFGGAGAPGGTATGGAGDSARREDTGSGGATAPPAARFRCVLSVAAPDGRIVARGEGACEGVLVEVARGTGGFGYDPHFLVPELGRTFAEIRPEEKNRVSHRARAAEALRRSLATLLDSPSPKPTP